MVRRACAATVVDGSRVLVGEASIQAAAVEQVQKLHAVANAEHWLVQGRELREQRATFAFETTLASRTFAPFLREARDAGYVVHLVYVSLESADLAVRRVRIRVERGGHDIPEVTVRRRYARSLRNFFEIYRQLTDDWTLWDNSGADVVPVASGRTGAAPVLVNHDRWRSLSAEA